MTWTPQITLLSIRSVPSTYANRVLGRALRGGRHLNRADYQSSSARSSLVKNRHLVLRPNCIEEIS